MRKPTWMLSLAASLLKFLMGCGQEDFGSAARYTQDFQHTYPLQAGGRLSVETFNGAIEVSGWDQETVDISGTKYAATPELRDAITIEIVASPNAIAIRTIRPSDRRDNMGAKFIIRVPRRTQLERLTSSNASIQATDIDGGGRIHTSNGAVRLLNMRGELDVQTSNAGVEVRNLEGSSVVRTSNGGVRAEGVRGGFEAYTSNGGINVQLLSSEPGRAVTLESSNAGIELSLGADHRNDVRIATNNGGITVRLPASIGARVRARTSNAAIATDFELKLQGTISQNHLEGTIGGGGPTLDLSTSNGNIRLLRL